ncbi:SusC/RagA family TonB-linked outer membrane protein [Hymenobacter sediminicola]|uniref:SusC/RagA family TonB-linked outer membrane protein n=1 Tax=Hymenobacter sediminicola TaxID=2761579 RepID=A0A7G7W3F7_9BACT|nr:SusC/RagA family TonB-linked outer membrane protein [Hymenobacter sediminicola]QNH60900.1 SusC/RagA family TonB-linked outer membrane protein [Hymenobacter sediminicola]
MKHPYLAKLLFLLLFVCAGFTGAFAQTGSVSGRVVDEKNEGLPGVTVLIEGTSLGNSTNSDGTYSIQSVPAGSNTLVVSFVGYTTNRIPVTVAAGQNTAVGNVTLNENTTLLNEAVVVGYGTQRRQDVTGSIATVQAKDFVPGQVTNPEQLVQGKVAGVSITTGGGAPGSTNTIRIRGGSSLNANNDPLFVIDGVPVDKGTISGASNPLTLINPNDIESITVLKDASALAIYGNRASNGVVLITTKRGVQGEKLTVNFSSQTSVSRPFKTYDVLGADEFRTLIQANGSASQIATLGSANTNWQDEIFRTAATYDNNISLTGNLGKVPFRVSYGNLYQDGIVITNNLKRNTGSLSLSPVILDGHLRIDVNAKGTKLKNRFIDNGAIGGALFYDPTQPVRSSEAQYAPYGGYYQYLTANGVPLTLAPGNPVAALQNTNNISDVDRLIGNVQLDYKFHFLPELRANLNLATDISRGSGSTTNSVTDFGNFNSGATNVNQNGRFSQYKQDKDMRLLEFYLAYNKQLGENTKFDVQAGYSHQDFETQGPLFLPYRFDRTTKFNPTDTLTVAGYYDPYRLISYFGRANLSIKDRYLLTATLRNDNTSRFGEGNRSGYFPALGLGWRLKGEEFFANNASITELKLRAGYGITGQQEIGGPFDYLPRYVTSRSTVQYQFGVDANGAPIFVTGRRPAGYNPDLKWETTTTYNLGLDWGIMDNRLSGSFDVYQRESNELLANVFVPAGGLSNQLNRNIGSLRNRGVEVALNAVPVQTEDFTWDMNFNVAYNKTEITDLGTQQENFPGYLTEGIPGGTGTTVQINSVGYANNAYYVYQQAYGEDGRPLEGVYVDRSGDGNVNEQDLYRYKQRAPLATFGFTTNFTYKRLSLNAVLRANTGNYVYNSLAGNLANYANANTSTGFVGNLPVGIRETGFRSQQVLSDYYVENGSFLRGENVTLGYNFGKIFSEGSNLRLTAAVQNLFLITKYTGLDPEIFNGVDNNFYPRARTFTFGLNASF